MIPQFFRLPRLNLDLNADGSLSPFSVFTSFYENELTSLRGGRDLIRHAGNGIASEELKACEELVPFFDISSKRGELWALLEAKYSNVEFPCSLKIEDVKELEEHVLRTYQVANAHYVLGKHAEEIFPDLWCGRAGRGVAASLMAHGYPQATYVYDPRPDDHGYVLLPFKLAERVEGVILADPTSDQLWRQPNERLNNPPRNFVSVFLGNKWEYRTFWNDRADLYPVKVTHGGLFRNNLLSIKPLHSEIFYEYGCEAFLDRAFKNPIPFQGK